MSVSASDETDYGGCTKKYEQSQTKKISQFNETAVGKTLMDRIELLEMHYE